MQDWLAGMLLLVLAEISSNCDPERTPEQPSHAVAATHSSPVACTIYIGEGTVVGSFGD